MGSSTQPQDSFSILNRVSTDTRRFANVKFESGFESKGGGSDGKSRILNRAPVGTGGHPLAREASIKRPRSVVARGHCQWLNTALPSPRQGLRVRSTNA